MILQYLDEEIEKFRIRTGEYPTKIILSQKIKDKIFIELKTGRPSMDNCWTDSEDNYRGIIFKITNMEHIKLK